MERAFPVHPPPVSSAVSAAPESGQEPALTVSCYVFRCLSNLVLGSCGGYTTPEIFQKFRHDILCVWIGWVPIVTTSFSVLDELTEFLTNHAHLRGFLLAGAVQAIAALKGGGCAEQTSGKNLSAQQDRGESLCSKVGPQGATKMAEG